MRSLVTDEQFENGASAPSAEALEQLSLADLAVGRRAQIVRVTSRPTIAGEPPCQLEGRLLEIGFGEGDEIEIAHEGPLGGDPLAVRLKGSLVALRRSEARQVVVALLEG